MTEFWQIVEEFPKYEVSTLGTVARIDTGLVLNQTKMKGGGLKVGLSKDGKQYSRSVKNLVAQAFVEGRSVRFNTAICLDGNPDNVAADNLAWRPRYHAWDYSRQFTNFETYWDDYRRSIQLKGPVRNVTTGEIHATIYDAAIANGMLFRDIWRSIHIPDRPAFPQWYVFEFV
jgi:hypothetical protein